MLWRSILSIGRRLYHVQMGETFERFANCSASVSKRYRTLHINVLPPSVSLAMRSSAPTAAWRFLRDKVFFVTDNAHLIALDRANGKLLWETTMPEVVKQPYGGTVAPLIVGDTVIAGVAGGDHG